MEWLAGIPVLARLPANYLLLICAIVVVTGCVAGYSNRPSVLYDSNGRAYMQCKDDQTINVQKVDNHTYLVSCN